MDDEACFPLSSVRIWPKEVDIYLHRHQPEQKNGANMLR